MLISGSSSELILGLGGMIITFLQIDALDFTGIQAFLSIGKVLIGNYDRV